jgi:fructokinase
MKNSIHIIGIGEILWDVLPEGKRLGGAPCNFVFHAKKLGAKALILSAVGKDKNGKEILNELQAKNIPTELIQINDKLTGTVDVLLNIRGEPNYTIHENVAWDFILFNESIEKKVNGADVICFGSLAQRNSVSGETIEKILNCCKPETMIVFDINLRQHYYTREIIRKSLYRCNVLKLNEEELTVVCGLLEITGENELGRINKLIEQYDIELVAFTKGAEGSLLVTKSGKSYLSTPTVKVRDTVGAGDSFTAAMIVGLMNRDPLVKIHQKAVEIAAFVCTQFGAMPEYS